MSLFTRKKNTTTDVPVELADAYAAAKPDAAAFMERAASELAMEHYHPDAGKHSGQRDAEGVGRVYSIDPEQRQRMYVDHFPELLARAEHLSRLQAARWAVEMPLRLAQVEKESAERNTCPVCKEISKDLGAYLNPGLSSLATGFDAIRICTACRHTADLLYAQAIATLERQTAVRAAFGIPAPRN
jgi:hypothetical protein